jgi:hypothetical protein
MSAKTVLGAILVGAWLTCGLVHGQDPLTQAPARGPANLYPPADPNAAPPGPGDAPDAEPAAAGDAGNPTGYSCGGVCPTNTGLSDWILYRRDNGCQCAPGNGKTMMIEVYTRSGVAVPVGGGLLNDQLHAGWRIEAGGRSLWYNPTFTKAWVFDTGIVNTLQGGAGETHVPLSILINNPNAGQPNQPAAIRQNFGQGNLPGVTIGSLNRTMVGFGIGREWYLLAPANAPGNHWRWGTDFGGRYGTEKMDFNEIRHRTRVLENMYFAVHTDYEISCGDCIWYAGFRFEWDYTWSTILQTQHDLQDLNMLVTLGVRF